MSKPNMYELSDSSVHIVYTTSNIAGQPVLSFREGSNPEHTFGKNDIYKVHSEVGDLITVSLHPGPSADEGDPKLTILLPHVELNSVGDQQPIETIAFVTRTVRIAPHQRIQVHTVHGQASLVETIT